MPSSPANVSSVSRGKTYAQAVRGGLPAVSKSAESNIAKRVWVLVPFPEIEEGAQRSFHEPDFTDPHETGKDWVKAKNADTTNKAAPKTYQKIGLDELKKVDFDKDDRLYIHGHGGTLKNHPDRLFGRSEDKVGIGSKDLYIRMIEAAPNIFNSKKIDARIGSCHSAENKFAETFAKHISANPKSGGRVLGYIGNFEVTEMTRLISRRGGHNNPPARKLACVFIVNKTLVSYRNKANWVDYMNMEDRENFRAKGHRKTFKITSSWKA